VHRILRKFLQVYNLTCSLSQLYIEECPVDVMFVAELEAPEICRSSGIYIAEGFDIHSTAILEMTNDECESGQVKM